MSLGRCQGNSHNKIHFKECFQFLLREKKKEPGLASYVALLTFPLDSCNLYGRAQAVGEGRTLLSTDAKRGMRSGMCNPSHTVPAAAGDCPALHWFQNQAPLFCPELCPPGRSWSRTAGRPLRYVLPPITGAAQSSLRRPKTCSQTGSRLFLCWAHEMPIAAQDPL